MNDLLTAAEAAKLLGVETRKVHDFMSAGLLSCYRFGTDVRFSHADLMECDRRLMKVRSPRMLRETERLRLRIAEADRPPSSLSQNEMAITAKRYRNLRMVPWADGKAIRAIYAEARRLSREQGQPHQVDHVIPLQGEFVSGLHVHNNLQILTGAENGKKRNHYEVEA